MGVGLCSQGTRARTRGCGIKESQSGWKGPQASSKCSSWPCNGEACAERGAGKGQCAQRRQRSAARVACVRVQGERGLSHHTPWVGSVSSVWRTQAPFLLSS